MHIYNKNNKKTFGKYKNRLGKELTKLVNDEKTENFVDENHKEKTNFYTVGNDAFNKNYKIIIKDNEDIPYVIAIVKVQDKKWETECYIISCLNYVYNLYENDYTNNKELFEVVN